MPSNQNTFVNTAAAHAIGRRSYTASSHFDGYLAEFHFVDGQALAATDFAEYDDNNVWQPKEFAGTYTFPAIQTVVWSNNLTADGGGSLSGTTSNGFNGDEDDYVDTSAGATLDLSGHTFGTGSHFVRIKTGGATSVTVNSTSLTDPGGGGAKVWYGTVTGELTSLSVAGGASIYFITVDGKYLIDQGLSLPSTNSFHLDFSDNSNNTALGFDANVEGARYSNFVTGAHSTYTAANMFDGSTSTVTLGPNGGGIMTFTPGTAIPYTAASGGVEVYFHNSSQGDRVRINGGSWHNQTTVNVGGWETVSTGDGSITKMEFQDQASSEPAIRAIRVNGTILTDPTGANDWTVNNLLAALSTPPFSWDGGTLNLSATGGSGNAGGYKNAYFLLPATGSHSWDMVLNTDSNTGFWFSDSSSASNTHSNQQAGNFVGLRNNGSGSASTGGSGFGSGSVSMPSDAMDGDPRWFFTIDRISGSGTVKAGSGGTSYSFTIPTSGNVYFHVNAYGAYEFNLSSGNPPDIDSLRDSPTNGDTDDDTGAGGEVSGNYASWNPLTNKGVVTTSQGNLTANATNSNYGYTLSTIPVSSGKYYCEISFEGTMSHNTNYNYIGIVPTDSAANYTGQDIFRADGALSIDSNSSAIRGTLGTGGGESSNTYQSSYGFDENDTIGIAIDCDTPQVTFYKNGTSIGTFSAHNAVK